MSTKGENEKALNIIESSTDETDSDSDSDDLIVVDCEPTSSNFQKKTINLTRPKFSGKRKLFRTGAARILKNLFDLKPGENIDERTSPVIPRRSGVARRGKPFRRQASRTLLVDGKLPNSCPESLTELVSEKNFCHNLLKNKDTSNDIKLFIEARLEYVDFKLKSRV